MNLCAHGNQRPCFACEYDGEPARAYDYIMNRMCDDPLKVTGRKQSEYMDGYCIHVRRLDLPCAECTEITGVKQVTGSDNPFYDLPYPVSSLRELVRAIDPHMSYCRYNIFKVAFRWEDKPSLRYNLEKARDSIDETLLSMPED